jgi:uncharacterized membrane protein
MKRIYSIDFTRGLVIVIMTLDHVRDMMYVDSIGQSPTNLATTTPVLFFTRWITHLCAPTFVFLAGVSAYISFKRSDDISATKRFLLTRGIWLVILEFTVVNFGIWFNFHFRTLIMEVICATGVGMIVLSFLLKFSPKKICIAGLIIIFGHNLLQDMSFPTHPALDVISSLLFRRNFFMITPNLAFVVGYPLVPWLGIIMAGFGCGQLFELSPEKRKKIFLQIGAVALLLFVIIRFVNIYGDPLRWSVQKTGVFTFLSFINITKYPPSLLFDLATLGIMFLILSLAEGITNRFTKFFIVYGNVPLFYFIIHMYLIHILMFVMVFMQGLGIKDLEFGLMQFGRPAKGTGIGLPLIYAIWMGVVLILYPLCKWYGKYKTEHRENKLLRYL